MQEQQLTRLREAWLERAASFLVDYMVQYGLPRTAVRVSCGWPSRGGLAARVAVIGQCFPPTVCRDGIPQVFVSPRIEDSLQVLGVLLHELVHAAIGCQFGHRKAFSQAARRVGLAGPPTATTIGDRLRPVLERFVAATGSYPHAAIQLQVTHRVGSRLRLYECQCASPIKVRVARNEFQARCLRCGGLFSRVENS
jgi:hypothetical protein